MYYGPSEISLSPKNLTDLYVGFSMSNQESMSKVPNPLKLELTTAL